MIDWFANLPLVERIGWSVLGLVLLGFVIAIFYFALRRITAWRNLQDLKVEDRVRLKIEIIKTAASILGGVFFLATLYFSWQNLVVSQERHRTDLFTKAIEQLGSKQLEVKLGGIYALERIARDSEKDHWTIMEVLTAYVRENAPWPPQSRSQSRKELPWVKIKDQETSAPEKGKGEEGKEVIWNIRDFLLYQKDKEKRIKPDTDIQAILTVIGRRQRRFREGEDQRLDLRETDLRGADLRHAHLERAILQKAHLEMANLMYANLEGAELYRAHLEGANLERTNLEGTDLRWAHLMGAKIINAKGLTEVQLGRAFINEDTRAEYLKHLEKSAGSKPNEE
jgi:hypothetical protein